MIREIQYVLLGVMVLSCWLGCVGMLRMKTATQALHFLALPSVIGSGVLPFAILCVTGWSTAAVKGALAAFFLIGTNSVVAHATARAFRVRSVGHWEPHAEDRIEFIGGRNPGPPSS